LEGIWTEGHFILVLVQGYGGGSEVLLEQSQLNFSFRNKFIIVLPCGLLVDSNTFLNVCILKIYYWLHLMMVVMKTERHMVNDIKIKGNEQLMLVILYCTLLCNQNDGWTLP